MCTSIYTTLGQVTEALTLLQSGGFESRCLSLIGRDRWSESQTVGFRCTGEEFVYGGNEAAAWEKVWQVIPERAGLWFFEDGPILVAGALTEVLTVTGDHEGENLRDALVGIGIPEDSAISYASELMNFRLLLFVHGSMEATDRAQRLLSTTPATNHTLHHGASE